MNAVIKFACLVVLALVLILAGLFAVKKTEKSVEQKTEEAGAAQVVPEAQSVVVAAAPEIQVEEVGHLSVEVELGLSTDEIDGEAVRGNNDNFFGMFCGLSKQGESAEFLKSNPNQPRNTRVSRDLEQVRLLTQHTFATTEPRAFFLSSLNDHAVVIPIGGNANLVLYRQAGVVKLVQKGFTTLKINPSMGSLVPMEFHATKNYPYDTQPKKSLAGYVMKRFYELQRVRKGELDIRFTYGVQSKETMLSVSPGQLKNVNQEDELELFEMARLKASVFAASFDNTTVVSLYSEAIHRPMSALIQAVAHGINKQDLDSVLVLNTQEFKAQCPTHNVVLARRKVNGKLYVQIAYPNLDHPLTNGFADMIVELFSLDNMKHVQLVKVLVEEPVKFSDI